MSPVFGPVDAPVPTRRRLTAGYTGGRFESALVVRDGRATDALRRAIDGKDESAVSTTNVDERPSVLARRFAQDREELARITMLVSGLAKSGEGRRAPQASRPAPPSRQR